MKYQLIGRDKLKPSPTNPRKDMGNLDDLTASIAKQGIIEPLIVRVKGDEFEIVAGERRWRASDDAGVTELPCIVRELKDEEVVEIQVIENMQRLDLSPIEEAEGYSILTSKYDYDFDEISAKVGKSKSYIYNRLRLLSLIPEIKKALKSGELPTSWAEQIIRLNEKQQKELFNDIGYVSDIAELKSKVEDFLLLLKDAPFNQKDSELPGGACVSCDKRTGHDPDLFGDASKTDTCLNPPCWKNKVSIFIKETREHLVKRGWKEMTKEQKKDYRFTTNLVDINDSCYPLKGKMTYKKWIDETEYKNVFFYISENGIVTSYVNRNVTKKMPKKYLAITESDRASPEEKEKERKEKEKAALDEKVNEKILDCIWTEINGHKGKMPADFLRVVMGHLAEDNERLKLRMGVEKPSDVKDSEIAKAICCQIIDNDWCGNLTDSTKELVKILGVDMKAVKKNATAMAKEELTKSKEKKSVRTDDEEESEDEENPYET